MQGLFSHHERLPQIQSDPDMDVACIKRSSSSKRIDIRPFKKQFIASQRIMGLNFPAYPPYEAQKIVKALHMKLRPSDVILCHYPMTENSWIFNSIWKLLHCRMPEFPPDFELWDSFMVSNVEYLGTKQFEREVGPRLARYHVPYPLIPKNPHTKYIYIVRDPKDVVVSYYTSTQLKSGTKCNFSQFYEDFVTGSLPYESYFDHVLSWNSAKEKNPNVMIVSYEHFHIDPRNNLRRIAKFLNPEYLFYLNEDRENIEKVLSASACKYSAFTLAPPFVTGKPEPTAYETMSSEEQLEELKKKAIVRTWTKLMDSDLAQSIDEISRSKFGGTDIMNLWDI